MSLEQHLSNEQLTAIAAEYGTPVYVYNADKITTQYQQLTTAFAGQQVRFFMLAKPLPIRIFCAMCTAWVPVLIAALSTK
jgi:Diaminopimelate decarboxylase